MSVPASPFSQIAARSLMKVGQNYSEQPQVPAAKAVPKSTLDQALELAGKGFAWCIAREKEISAPFASIPYPSLGAARILDFHAGLPHGHAHWPLPNVPLPSIGPLIPIPKISGADKTKIQDQAAARCGDFGIGIWCGGFTPMNEVFFGSASVWIESCRAARTLDITDHCMLVDPASCGVAKGAIVDSSDNVKIGGVQMPSLTQAAIAAGIKAAMKGLGKALAAASRKIGSIARVGFQKAASLFARLGRLLPAELRTLSRFIWHAKLGDNLADKLASARHLRKIVRVAENRAMLDDLIDAGRRVDLSTSGGRACCAPDNMLDGMVKTADNPNGKLLRQIYDQNGRVRGATPADIVGKGPGTGSVVHYDPYKPQDLGPGIGSAPPEVVLVHELQHARDFARGEYPGQLTWKDPAQAAQWQDLGERRAVELAENPLRKSLGMPLRDRYAPKTLVL